MNNILPPLNQCAVSHRDKFLIVYSSDNLTWRIMEGQPNMKLAKRALEILTKNESNRKFKIIPK